MEEQAPVEKEVEVGGDTVMRDNERVDRRRRNEQRVQWDCPEEED